MRCISPLLIRKDGRRDVVPCGKCNFCLQQRRNDWSFRLQQEHKLSSSAYFPTFTYDEEHVPSNGSVDKELFQKFLKRLRKVNSQPLRYYAVGEYGTKSMRPHYHAIMFNLDAALVAGRRVPGLEGMVISEELTSLWGLGNVITGTVTPKSIHYVTKYVINASGDVGDRAPPFSLMSRRPGIGQNYLKTHYNWHKKGQRNFTQVNGIIGRLPRYYKEKIFDRFERARFASLAVEEGVEMYREEISRLMEFHADPCAYYDERNAWAHNSVKSKVNVTNKF